MYYLLEHKHDTWKDFERTGLGFRIFKLILELHKNVQVESDIHKLILALLSSIAADDPNGRVQDSGEGNGTIPDRWNNRFRLQVNRRQFSPIYRV